MSYSQDNFPTAGQWELQSYNQYKQWPTSVNPNEVTVNQKRITLTNYSHNGRKFTRRSSQPQWQLEVSYPPVTHAQFTAMHAIVLAAQGQYNPFLFDVDYLWHYNDDATSTVDQRRQFNFNDRGLRASRPEWQIGDVAFEKGEVIQIPEGKNGGINIVVGDVIVNEVDVNGDGVVEVPLAYPVDSDLSSDVQVSEFVSEYREITRKVQQVVVTLAENGFEYQVLENGFYLVSVIFDLDEWK